jgi:heterodisulfide reductase subunit B
MKFAYYPGCSLHSTGTEFDESFKAVCKKLEIELEEVPGWICCGTSPAHSTSRLLSLAMPLKNLVLAERTGLEEMVVPCAACFSRFKIALYEVGENEELKREVDEVVGSTFQGGIKVVHPLEVFSQLDSEMVRSHVTRDLSGLKVACYYGCLLTRPPKATQFDVCEYPVTMDEVLRNVGIRTLDWSYKTECCGGIFSLTETDIVLKLVNDILNEAKAVGADAIAVACPLCHANLDTRLTEIEAKYAVDYGNMPTFYFTQLMGLAFGLSHKQLALGKHIVDPEPLLRERVPA